VQSVESVLCFQTASNNLIAENTRIKTQSVEYLKLRVALLKVERQVTDYRRKRAQLMVFQKQGENY
jgi:hypothetical protein